MGDQEGLCLLYHLKAFSHRLNWLYTLPEGKLFVAGVILFLDLRGVLGCCWSARTVVI